MHGAAAQTKSSPQLSAVACNLAGGLRLDLGLVRHTWGTWSLEPCRPVGWNLDVPHCVCLQPSVLWGKKRRRPQAVERFGLFMEHRSLIEYVENFRQHGRECAYVDQRGYRSLRRSYGQTAELAWQFAQELEKRGIGKANRVLISSRATPWKSSSPRELPLSPRESSSPMAMCWRISSRLRRKSSNT